MPVNNVIKLRRGDDWSNNPVLAEGEPGFDSKGPKGGSKSLHGRAARCEPVSRASMGWSTKGHETQKKHNAQSHSANE